MQHRGTGKVFIGTAATAMAGVVITALLAMNYTLETALTPGAATVGVTVGSQTRPSRPSQTQSTAQQSIPPSAPFQPGTPVPAVDVTASATVPTGTVAAGTRPAPVSLVVRVGASPAAATASVEVSIPPVALPSVPAVVAAPVVPVTRLPIAPRPGTPATPATRASLAAVIPGLRTPATPVPAAPVRAQQALPTPTPTNDDGDDHDNKRPVSYPTSNLPTTDGQTTPPAVTAVSGPATTTKPSPMPVTRIGIGIAPR